MKKTLATLLLSGLSMSAMANVNNLNESSSWTEIMSTPNIEVKGDGIKVGSTNTTVFFVEEQNGMLYTKKATKDGYYKPVRSGGDNDRHVWVETGKSIKSGPVTISLPKYEMVRINKDRDETRLLGYEDYTQPLTRTIEVYEVKKGKNSDTERLLFKKDFTVPSRM